MAGQFYADLGKVLGMIFCRAELRKRLNSTWLKSAYKSRLRDFKHEVAATLSGTVVKFLRDVPDNATSSSALYPKVGILYEEGHPPRRSLSFRALSTRAFPEYAIPLRCATIQLYETSTSTNRLQDAHRCPRHPNTGLLEPAVAPLWTTNYLTFLAEIDRQRHEDRETNTVEMLKCVDRLIAAMGFFGPRCRLLNGSCFPVWAVALTGVVSSAAQLEALRRAYQSVQVECLARIEQLISQTEIT
ncbi:hypothetical protein B0H14DRAFT_2584029 [Mycena olivaceomarginata]|nr:hypothetical protein B0H14DRAFT_2584029 [Mycena olivaceomarginata]